MTSAINIQCRPTPLIWVQTGGYTPGDQQVLATDDTQQTLTDEDGNPILVE